MSEEQKIDPNIPPPPPSAGEVKKELFSEQKEDFIEALECLYIKGNQSGRLMFADKWPVIAEKIFPKELTKYDHKGLSSPEDREKRDALELDAELKHDEILSVFDGMETELVVHGSLQLPALEAIMQKIDRDLAEFVFAERFVNRFFPDGAPAPIPPEQNTESVDNNAAPLNPDDQAKPVNDTEFSAVPSVENEAADAPAIPPSDKPADIEPESPQAHPVPHNSADAKESVVVPDTESNSIGHVDHSYDTKIPDYDNPKSDINLDGVMDENDGASSWLDEPDDEFEDVVPISTEPESKSESEVDKPPPTMGLKAHQETGGADEAPAESQAETQDENFETAGAMPSTAPPPSSPDAALSGQPPAPEETPAPSAPQGDRKPSLTDMNASAPSSSGVPPLPGADSGHSPSGAPPLPDTQNQAVPVEQESKPVFGDMPPPPQSSPVPESEGSKPVFGDMPPPPSSASNPPPNDAPAADQSRVPPLPGANAAPQAPSSAPAAENNAPRKPSLDDIDKHAGSSSKSGVPPLPGHDDDGSDY